MHFTTFLMKRKLESSKLFIFHFRFKYKIDLLVKAQQLSNSIFYHFLRATKKAETNYFLVLQLLDYFVPLFLLVCDCFVFVLSFLYCANFPSFCVLHR